MGTRCPELCLGESQAIMKLQGNILIPEAKLTEYLLVLRSEDDKSKFLAQVGFTQDNPDQLKQAIFNLMQTHDAVSDR